MVPQSELDNLRAENAQLRSMEARYGAILDRLKTLSVVERELSRIDSFDLLCFNAVEWGRSRLGFDRRGLWFLAENPDELHGTYGTDEEGNIRDERHLRIPAQFYSGMPRFLQNEEPLVFNEDFVHRNDIGEVIGHGNHA